MKKKLMKKTLALVAACAMGASLVACSSGSTETGEADESSADVQASAEEEASATEEQADSSAETAEVAESVGSFDGMGGYKIGFWYLPAESDETAQGFHNVLDYCAEVTNCEMVYYDMTAFGSSDQMAAVESLVSQGCDGIICVLGDSPSMMEYMNENGVYYGLMSRSISDEINAVVLDSEYFTGYNGDAGGENGGNYRAGYLMGQTAADDGRKAIGLVAASEGETMNDEFVEGVEAAAADYGMEIVSTYRGTDASTGCADMLASYGADIDCIIDFAAGGDAVLANLQSAGLLGQVGVYCTSCSDPVSYFDAGYLSALFQQSGNSITMMYMQVFNGLSGAEPLYDENYLVSGGFGVALTSSEDYEEYAELLSANAEVPCGIVPNDLVQLNSIASGYTKEEVFEFMSLFSDDATYFGNFDEVQARVDAYLATK